MSQKTFNYIVGIIFIIISALHLIRSILGWSANIGGVEIPVGVSVVAFIIAGFLAYSGFKLGMKDITKEEVAEEDDMLSDTEKID
ncbi:MAG: hypothetical protein US50_C0038G0008 [Candidatus Nomurabacteria bacterium GW2011_GWB1_37_5]|uniref:Uncharacterized protein n=1 Tax=Candidatus Nomurabacteria bacterium GW2011_GWB1_37_5 TaxID=1618742 RepID=A0A0G0GUR8_9BACT|nr:MAG: hypothetical protein US50_C0038G0008 [Candidatus Nomurabacteria bacterium GW2011_GWB1_37_5]